MGTLICKLFCSSHSSFNLDLVSFHWNIRVIFSWCHTAYELITDSFFIIIIYCGKILGTIRHHEISFSRLRHPACFIGPNNEMYCHLLSDQTIFYQIIREIRQFSRTLDNCIITCYLCKTVCKFNSILRQMSNELANEAIMTWLSMTCISLLI